jgi:hypothetical protein
MSVNSSTGILSVYNNQYSGYTTGNYIYTSMMGYTNGVRTGSELNTSQQQDEYGTQVISTTNYPLSIIEVKNIYGTVFSGTPNFSGACFNPSILSATTNTSFSGSSTTEVNYQMQFDPTVYNNYNISNFVVSVYDYSNILSSANITYPFNYVKSAFGYIDDSIQITGGSAPYSFHLDYYSGSSVILANKITGYTYNLPTYS